jgi:UDPglucose 6-dehydrogenase
LLTIAPSTAETIKYASNAFLTANLSSIKEVANLCDAVDADSEGVFHEMSYNRRIGAVCLRLSPGWGGPRVSKDAHALVNISRRFGYGFALVRTAIEVNERQMDLIGVKMRSAVWRRPRWPCGRRVVAVWSPCGV